MYISSVKEMREMDRTAIEEYGIVEEILMENAGMAAFHLLSAEMSLQGRHCLVFCGGGNNGGDGLVVARKIFSAGGIPVIVLLSDPGKYRGAALTNYNIIQKLPVKKVFLNDLSPDLETGAGTNFGIGPEIISLLENADVIIDAIFGTGLSREVGGRYREVIEKINLSGKPVLSLDIPSGVNGDTGQVMGTAVQADYTVTFGLPKTGNLLYPGYALGGKLHVTHISFPPAIYRADHLKIALNSTIPLPGREPDGHKGSFGRMLCIAGAGAYYGAPVFAARSFLKAGGGYARLASPKSMIPFLAAHAPEIVFHPQEETGDGSVAFQNKKMLLDLAGQTDVVVMGPGLSLNDDTQKLIRELALAIEQPLLLDGDAITAVSHHPEIFKQRSRPTVLTPHMGEMARLTGLSIAEISGDRIRVVQETCADLNAIIVLKGAHSLIGLPDGRVFINMSGNSGMGTAGSGDVLAGVIAAMFGIGLPSEEAVCKGVFLHGMAGDLAAREQGEDSITAVDILAYLPPALKTDREGWPRWMKKRYEIPLAG